MDANANANGNANANANADANANGNANANANADTGGSTIALHELCSGELKRTISNAYQIPAAVMVNEKN